MLVVDANVLVYAVNTAEPQHERSHRWLTDAFAGDETVGLPWSSLIAFLRVVTNPRLAARVVSYAAAADVVEAWLAQPVARIVEPGPGHWPIFRRLLHDVDARGGLVHDAHLAALAIEHDATLISFDADFGRFPELRWTRPGVDGAG